MVLFLTKILERGKVNNKQLLRILKDHEARLDALEGENTETPTEPTEPTEPSDNTDEPTEP